MDYTLPYLHFRSIFIFSILIFAFTKAECQWSTLDPDNEYTYTFTKSFFFHTFGKTMHVQFGKDEIILDGKAYRKIEYSIKPTLDIPFNIKDYLYREEGFKIYRRIGQNEEILIDYDAKVGDKFLNNKWEVIQKGILDGKRMVVLMTPLGPLRWIEGSGGDAPFFIDESIEFNSPFLCKMINYSKEFEYYNSLLCKKSEIEIKYIDPSHLWKYNVPGVFNNQPYSYYTKILPDTTILNQKKYFRGSTYSVSSQKWFNGNSLYREFSGKVFNLVDGKEIMIYNFNLVVGDSISDENNGKIKVVKLDTIQTADGKMRKRWTFDKLCRSVKFGSLEWIEGIGTTKGEYYPGNICIVADPSSQLSCFLENKVPVLYLGDCFDDLVGTADALPPIIDIHPMPVLNYVHFESKNIPIKEFKIYSNLGQMIHSKVVNVSYIIEDFSFLEAGAYVIQIHMENQQVVTRKLLKL